MVGKFTGHGFDLIDQDHDLASTKKMRTSWNIAMKILKDCFIVKNFVI